MMVLLDYSNLAERRIDVTVEQLFWCQMDILLERGNKENHLSFAFQKSELLYCLVVTYRITKIL
jgi:hypothetical protein